MRQISFRRERDRVVVAAVTALIIHGAIFILIPFSTPAERERLDPPLYVALDPVPPEAPEPIPEPETSEPIPQEEPDPQSPQDLPDEPDPPPSEQDALRADDPAPPIDRSETGTETPSQTAPEPPPEAEPAPEADADADPDPAPSAPAFVESPPPPPPPPRVRRRSDIVTDFGGGARETEFAGLEQEISALYDWQSQYQEELEAWQERQEERSSQVDAEQSPDDTRAAEDTALAQRLSDLIEGIRAASSNVVDSDDSAPRQSSQADETSGDGSGIEVEGDSGSRVRLSGAAVDLTSVSLGAGFPPDYPVQVRFTVNAAGTVIDARVQPPTPEPELNRAIEDAVEDWRFQPAPAGQSGLVEGFVTIIVQTR